VSKKKDIAQIRKYLKGELDGPAMHELERRAQDDPFLMDALEGYEQAGNDQQANLDDLANRLHRRLERKEHRIIPWGPISIAASLLILLGTGLWVFTGNQRPAKPAKIIAQTEKPVIQEKANAKPSAAQENDNPMNNAKVDRTAANQKKLPASASSAAMAVEADAVEVDEPISTASRETLKRYKADKDSTSLNDLVVSNYKSSKPKIDTGLATVSNLTLAKKTQANSPAQILQGKAPGVTVTITQADPRSNSALRSMGLNVTPEPTANADKTFSKYKQRDTTAQNEVTVTGYARQRKKDVTGSVATVTPQAIGTNKTISGMVTGKDDGQPIIGATVKLAGAGFGVVTDVNGKFVLPNASGNQSITVAYIGYASKKVTLNGRDSLNIALDPIHSSLNEVVVTGYSNQNSGREDVYENAHPDDGWSAFRKYINEKAVSADGKTGRVRMSFTVEANGSLSNFKIIKSLSTAADQKAIDLLKSGPAWVSATDRKPTIVRVNIKFH
jgi:CarboxypepD_reg-like domain